MPPLRFLITATTCVLVLHYYIGARLLGHGAWPAMAVWLGWTYLGVSAFLQPLAVIARSFHSETLRDLVSWVAMTVMGISSSLLVLTLLRDGLLVGVAAWQACTQISLNSAAFASHSAMAVIVLAFAMSLIGFIQARQLARVVHISVPLRNLAPALQGFRIVQISDIHVGPTIKHGYLARIVARVNALEADMIAITGDLVDGRVHELAAHTQPLAELQARHGSFFVTGNHEYYAGALAWVSELTRLGLRVLLNEHVTLAHADAQLVVAGVTDVTAGHFYPEHTSDPHAAIAGAPDHAPKILLAHQPRSAAAAAAAGFDLQLSGHTHGGQFWPWHYFVPLQQPYVAGLHRLQALWIYVSQGTGYWGPPNRFGSPSEITCVTLVAAHEAV